MLPSCYVDDQSKPSDYTLPASHRDPFRAAFPSGLVPHNRQDQPQSCHFLLLHSFHSPWQYTYPNPDIHFQYNIIMQAVFLLSVHLIQQKKFLRGAFLYSCLLNFKHIYLYASLAFLAYILKQYVFKG